MVLSPGLINSKIDVTETKTSAISLSNLAVPLTGFTPKTYWFHKCFMTIRVKKDTKYYANSENTWLINIKSTSINNNLMDYDEIFETTSTDEDCKIKSMIVYKDTYEMGISSSLIQDIAKKGARSAISTSQSFPEITFLA